MFGTGRVLACGILAGAVLSFSVAVRSSGSPNLVFDVPGRTDATPWVASSGSTVVVAWGASDGGKTDVFVAVSRNGGATFGPAVQVNTARGEARLGGELPPRVALASRPGRVPEIVVTWTARGETTAIKLARSRDAGRTFTGPVVLQSETAAGDRGWPAVTVDSRGGIHAVWLDHRGLAADPASAATHRRHDRGREHDGVAMAQKSGLYYTSLAGGREAERRLTAGVCYCCKTAVAAGPNGRLYAAWRHVYPGNLRDMAFAMSVDGGRSFTRPVRVNEDGWAIDGCPDDGPAMAVDERGIVHLIWRTVIASDGGESVLFYAAWDGARFTRPVRVPTVGANPAHPQIVAAPRGRILAAWDETVKGRRIAAMRELRGPATPSLAFGDVVELSSDASAVYPVLTATDRGVFAVWTSGGHVQRIEGRTIRLSGHPGLVVQ